MAELEIGDYETRQSDEALELERCCPQGGSYRLRFQRDAFHLRAEGFPEHRLITARAGGRMVGIVGVALKTLETRWGPAAFLFDLRVHPERRREGVGRRLVSEALSWGLSRAAFAYTYAVADNEAPRRIARLMGGEEAGGYDLLVYPTSRGVGVDGASRSAFEDVEDASRRHAPACDLGPLPGAGPPRGYVGSWILRRGSEVAGASAASLKGILSEVVESLPLPLAFLGRALRSWPLRRLRVPHVPAKGEELRSWYLFDAFATSPALGRELLAHVSAEARGRGVDFCYLPHAPGEAWVREARRGVPRLLAPVIPYRLLARARQGPVPRVERLRVDVRDL